MAEAIQRSMTDINRDMMPDYLSTERARPDQITFTPQQLAALETVFPEIAAGSDALTDAKVRHHLGQRSVVAFIRDRVRR